MAQASIPANDAAYRPRNHVRIVTAASLFDGHDASINIMRRILQSLGAEVIHLGHNRSVAEIVDCAIQEDVQGIAVTSYQGGHLEYFKYMYDLLQEQGSNIKIFGGGGGTILPSEIQALHDHGITRVYSPDDGRAMGLQGMITDVLEKCDFSVPPPDVDDAFFGRLEQRDSRVIARLITVAENEPDAWQKLAPTIASLGARKTAPVLGVTGTGGAGKSSLVDELVRRFQREFPEKSVAIISIDPSRRRSGGALLGDRIRMNSIHTPNVYMRSLATRQSNLSMSPHVRSSIDVCHAAGFDLIIVETSGIGQSDTEITNHCDIALYVMTADYGAATQLEKIDMLDFADVVAINKFDRGGSLDALRDVRKQFKRNHEMWDVADDDVPVFGSIASQFGDRGTDALYRSTMDAIVEKTGASLASGASAEIEPGAPTANAASEVHTILPPERVRYLAEIAEASDEYDRFVVEQSGIARRLFQVSGAIKALAEANARGEGRRAPPSRRGEDNASPQELLAAPDLSLLSDNAAAAELARLYDEIKKTLHPECLDLLQAWPATVARYQADEYEFKVRDRVFKQALFTESLSHLRVPKLALPKFQDWGDILKWLLTENLPGFFPYAAGVFPLKREGEDPTRMFAGEGGPERTNRRFHYVSKGMPAKRLSTAFDSVTLYGDDPDHRPDIYGKVGNSGVNIANVDDAKKLYSGFDLSAPTTSVSMTINGPAPMLLGFFMNAAVDQQCERHIREAGMTADVEKKIVALYKKKGAPRPRYHGELPENNDGLGLLLLGVSGDEVLPAEVYGRIKAKTLSSVRGTVQADILKEDQAQNTCIFSTEFALRMMGDIQQYFIEHQVRNFYSVSISGYHIAEAGANPISQTAFTLSNGFTFVEYYLARGMHIDDFAPNLSFFFSNGLDPEYAVIGRVARRIWAKAMKRKYGANDRSQKLKYHIQTSGRSLHAQEISFNDIRTTLQALYAIYDNCNSLHTNAYDEAITTPTEESVRRAVAIQLIINHELGMTMNENPLQGAFIIEELTDLVEQAVLSEFRRISERGGVLGAMERMYQRSKIQEESLYYESRKHSGELPIIGVNTFLSSEGSPTVLPREVIRSTTEEKEFAIQTRDHFWARNSDVAPGSLAKLQRAAIAGENTFESMMEAAKVCSLGQISQALYEVGGKYRRSM